MGGCPLVFLAEAGMPWPQLWGAIPQHCPGQIYDPPSADSLWWGEAYVSISGHEEGSG